MVRLILSLLMLVVVATHPLTGCAKSPATDDSHWANRLWEPIVNKGVMSGNPGIVSRTEIGTFLAGRIGLPIPSQPAVWLWEGISAIHDASNEEDH
ncbi:MAG: hypothetical protein MK108_14205 [Mariniblastus sp.]|nr:hypothetical protein [Mariniblastus sp.]